MASSGATSPLSDWEQFYQLQNLSGQASNTQTSFFGDHVMDAMAGTSTVITASPTSPCSQGDTTSPFSSNLNPEGRVSKPARRRSRASRRTPTTLVNTDPSNFRAMVQQFTGGPAAVYAVEPRYPAPREENITFGFRQNPQMLNPTAVHAQQLQQQQRQAHQQQQVQYQHNMFSSMNTNHDGPFL